MSNFILKGEVLISATEFFDFVKSKAPFDDKVSHVFGGASFNMNGEVTIPVLFSGESIHEEDVRAFINSTAPNEVSEVNEVEEQALTHFVNKCSYLISICQELDAFQNNDSFRALVLDAKAARVKVVGH